MRVKNSNPINLLRPDAGGVDPIILAYLQINHLKQLFRQGWLKEGRNVPEDKCESVGDHTFGTITLALLILTKYFPEIDAGKVVIMLAIHELGEIYDGDRTPHERIPPDVRHARELASFKRIFEYFPEGEIYIHLWEEMETGKTKEAKFAKQIDALEMALQAFIYEKQLPSSKLDDFFPYVEGKLKAPLLQHIMQEIKKLR